MDENPGGFLGAESLDLNNPAQITEEKVRYTNVVIFGNDAPVTFVDITYHHRGACPPRS